MARLTRALLLPILLVLCFSLLARVSVKGLQIDEEFLQPQLVEHLELKVQIQEPALDGFVQLEEEMDEEFESSYLSDSDSDLSVPTSSFVMLEEQSEPHPYNSSAAHHAAADIHETLAQEYEKVGNVQKAAEMRALSKSHNTKGGPRKPKAAAPAAKAPAHAKPAKAPAHAKPAKAPAHAKPAKAPAHAKPAKAPAHAKPAKAHSASKPKAAKSKAAKPAKAPKAAKPKPAAKVKSPKKAISKAAKPSSQRKSAATGARKPSGPKKTKSGKTGAKPVAHKHTKSGKTGAKPVAHKQIKSGKTGAKPTKAHKDAAKPKATKPKSVKPKAAKPANKPSSAKKQNSSKPKANKAAKASKKGASKAAKPSNAKSHRKSGKTGARKPTGPKKTKSGKTGAKKPKKIKSGKTGAKQPKKTKSGKTGAKQPKRTKSGKTGAKKIQPKNAAAGKKASKPAKGTKKGAKTGKPAKASSKKATKSGKGKAAKSAKSSKKNSKTAGKPKSKSSKKNNSKKQKKTTAAGGPNGKGPVGKGSAYRGKAGVDQKAQLKDKNDRHHAKNGKFQKEKRKDKKGNTHDRRTGKFAKAAKPAKSSKKTASAQARTAARKAENDQLRSLGSKEAIRAHHAKADMSPAATKAKFAAMKASTGRNYTSAAEEKLRLDAFSKNRENIQKLNAKYATPTNPKPYSTNGPFADRTPAEIKSMTKSILPPGQSGKKLSEDHLLQPGQKCPDVPAAPGAGSAAKAAKHGKAGKSFLQVEMLTEEQVLDLQLLQMELEAPALTLAQIAHCHDQATNSNKAAVRLQDANSILEHGPRMVGMEAPDSAMDGFAPNHDVGSAGGSASSAGGSASSAGGSASSAGGSASSAGGSASSAGGSASSAGGSASSAGGSASSAGGSASSAGGSASSAGGSASSAGGSASSAGGSSSSAGGSSSSAGGSSSSAGGSSSSAGGSSSSAGGSSSDAGGNTTPPPVPGAPKTVDQIIADRLKSPQYRGMLNAQARKDIGRDLTDQEFADKVKATAVIQADGTGQLKTDNDVKMVNSKGQAIDVELDNVNQGKDGTCWAHSSAAAATLALSQQGVNVKVSAAQLLTCASGTRSNYGTNGGSPVDALTYLSTHPAVDNWNANSKCPDAAPAGKCTACLSPPKPLIKTCTSGTCPDQGAQETALASAIVDSNGDLKTPTVVYVDASKWANYNGGVYNGDCSSNSDDGNHAVTIIGTKVVDGTKCWVVRNSWGSKWGSNGLIYLPVGGNKCGIANYPIGA